MKFSTFFLLTCGAIVKQAEAFAGLKAVAKRYFGSISIESFLISSPGLTSQMHSLLVLSISSATRSQVGWYPTLTKWS